MHPVLEFLAIDFSSAAGISNLYTQWQKASCQHSTMNAVPRETESKGRAAYRPLETLELCGILVISHLPDDLIHPHLPTLSRIREKKTNHNRILYAPARA